MIKYLKTKLVLNNTNLIEVEVKSEEGLKTAKILNTRASKSDKSALILQKA